MMRLTPLEQDAIADAARRCFVGGTRVSLFGSRVDDAGRGGDIDLLIESSVPMSAAEWVRRRGAFIAQLYRSIGERRIDVVLVGHGELAASPEFEASARRQAVALVNT